MGIPQEIQTRAKNKPIHTIHALRAQLHINIRLHHEFNNSRSEQYIEPQTQEQKYAKNLQWELEVA